MDKRHPLATPGTLRDYYRLLDRFVQTCNDLIDSGMGYLVVILCHELTRFLYRHDPYAQFTHSDSIRFMTAHIGRLIQLAEDYRKVVIPYAFDLRKLDGEEWKDRSLAKSASNFYSIFWKDFDIYTLTKESCFLLRNRIPRRSINQRIIGKKVLDMGCGSGRYSVALARFGAKEVVAVDLQSKSFMPAKMWCEAKRVPVKFQAANVHHLPFPNESFDFVFCNGVLQATSSIERGIRELARVMRPTGEAFLYLVGTGGICWNTRRELRRLFKKIPVGYTKTVLRFIGTPSNRFIFSDIWQSPRETQITKVALERMLARNGLRYQKVVSKNRFDLDRAAADDIRNAKEMWGDGEHRYILTKKEP